MGFRANVLQILESKGLTQSDLAARLGKSQPNISMLLKKDKPSHNTITDFAKALGVEPVDLMEDGEESLLRIKDTAESTTPYQRLFDYFQTKSLHPDFISDKLGVPYIRLYNNALKRLDIDVATAEKLRSFKDLNVTWVLTGEGEMLIPVEAPPWEWETQLNDSQPFYVRVWEYLKKSNVSLGEFTEKVGPLAEHLILGLNGGLAAGADEALIVSKAFPELNFLWLLTGQGEMVNKSSLDVSEEPNISDDFDLLTIKEGTEFRTIRNSDHILVVTPTITQEAENVYLKHRDEEDFEIEDLPKHLVCLPRLKMGVYRSFEDRPTNHLDNYGDKIFRKVIVTGRKIERLSKRSMEFLREGFFVFVEKENIEITQVVAINPNNSTFTCFSKEMDDVFEIRLENVIELFEVEVTTVFKE